MKDNSEQYFLHIEKSVGRGINTYSLIKENDRVAVALSGGKDSLVMLETVANRRRRLPVTYDVMAVHVHVKNIGYETDLDFLNRFCDELNVPLYIIETEADLERDKNKSVCFICSWLRRKELFDFVKKEKCTKLAFGHHRDDAIETLLMNMISNSSISSMPPSLSMFGGEFDLIRPLILLGEDEIREYAKLRKYPPQVKICPHGDDTRRADARRLLMEMEKIDKNVRQNIYSAMSNIHNEYLPPAKK
ncbi:MAG TPA: tRNA 2-thiocytidine biosynthesis TtcA family protein [Spirochaetota bacterium]|nr:tRNA 2-thiocytidine biosynthesis TtcA family protein [Spirochaetota bacterium]HPS86947.1 tRNA 2-thiocytidine biosynthesis TtcA family protein [Spirochaetota bacterium]